MSMRIMETRNGEGSTIRVDGWLKGQAEASELLRVARGARPPVALDLEELRSADGSGIEVLHALEEEGVQLRRTSDFIQLLLERRLQSGDHGD